MDKESFFDIIGTDGHDPFIAQYINLLIIIVIIAFVVSFAMLMSSRVGACPHPTLCGYKASLIAAGG